MKNNIIRQSFVLFVCYTLVFSPLLRSAQLSLPSGDLIAPKITQDKYIDTVEKNKNHKISVTVKDNVGVKQVVLYYRVIGTEQYKTQNMQNIKGSDDYQVIINSKNIRPPGIEYYVQAMDHAGNTLLHGYSFSPLSVKTVAATTAAAVAGDSDISKSTEKDDDIFSNKWLWIGLGVLVVGAAAGGGGGGGGGDTATLSITAAEPVP